MAKNTPLLEELFPKTALYGPKSLEKEREKWVKQTGLTDNAWAWFNHATGYSGLFEQAFSKDPRESVNARKVLGALTRGDSNIFLGPTGDRLLVECEGGHNQFWANNLGDLVADTDKKVRSRFLDVVYDETKGLDKSRLTRYIVQNFVSLDPTDKYAKAIIEAQEALKSGRIDPAKIGASLDNLLGKAHGSLALNSYMGLPHEYQRDVFRGFLEVDLREATGAYADRFINGKEGKEKLDKGAVKSYYKNTVDKDANQAISTAVAKIYGATLPKKKS